MQKPRAGTLRAQHSATLAELDKYKLLVESVQDYAIFLLDPDGYIMTWNKGAERNKGYNPDEIIGKHFSTFYLERDKQAGKPERELELAQRLGKVEDEDWRVRKDGSQFWANVVITALFADDGTLVGYAKVTRDLTERKQHEDKLRQANILLRQQQRELEQLNAMKDEFISLASHQLRTPATAIKQYLGMILEGFLGEPDERQHAAVQKAYDSNEHQLAIVNSLLEIAHIDSGKVILQPMAVPMHDMLREVIDNHSDAFRVRDQTTILDKPSAPPDALVDRHYFRMALENLIDNASKYTPPGGKIRVSVRTEGGRMLIAIKDTGVGISEDDIQRLFQKFSRIPNALSDKVGGSGLGLYWVSRVIALHKGQISVESVLDKGTTFTISVPLAESDA
jgi:PAS domain S-box-containing protein